MILENTLIEFQYEGTAKCPWIERVLMVDSASGILVTIKLNEKKVLPQVRDIENVEYHISQELAWIVEDDPSTRLLKLKEEQITHARRVLRDKAWECIEAIVDNPEVYFGNTRGPLIKKQVVEKGVTKSTLYKYCRIYWQNGKVINSLLPGYDRCGAPGKHRIAKSSDKKRGRPKESSLESGINLTESDYKKLKIGIKLFHGNREKLKIPEVYKKTMAKFYTRNQRLLAPDKRPTLGQFRYVLKKELEVTNKQQLLKREGERNFNLKHREKTGTTKSLAFGPGSLVQMDSTIFNIFLVSDLNPNYIIGKPVVYRLIDVFTRMIIGLYVGLSGPNWLGAAMALENAAADKVEFCKGLGIEITEADWPWKYLPERILTDRGPELASDKYPANLIKNLKVPLANTPPYRADLKGLIEKSFDVSDEKTIKFLPGAYTRENCRQRGEKRKELDAILTLTDFRKIMVLDVLRHNRYHKIPHHHYSEFMIADNVEPNPLGLWQWGLENANGHLRQFSTQIIKLNLLPTGKASVSTEGIFFKGERYRTENDFIRDLAFKNPGKSFSIDVVYDPRLVDRIYIISEDGMNFEPLDLYGDYKGISFDELEDFRKRINSELREHIRLQGQMDHDAKVKTIKEAAASRFDEQFEDLSDSERLKGIRTNKKIEAKYQEAKDAKSIGGKTNKKPSLESQDQEKEYVPAASHY